MIRWFFCASGLFLILLLACASTTAERVQTGITYSDTLKTAVTLVEARDLDGAERELNRVLDTTASRPVRAEAYWQLYLLNRDRGMSFEALQALVGCLELVTDQRSVLYGRARSSLGPSVAEALETDIPRSTIERLLGRLEDVSLYLDMADYLVETQHCYAATVFLNTLARRGLDPLTDQRRIAIDRDAHRCLQKTARSIQLIVPLTGDFAEYGANLARGVELALLDSTLESGLLLEKIDSESDPVKATQSVIRSAGTQHIVAAIGPLQSRAATGAALAAADGELPLLVPIPAPRGLSRFGEWIFQSTVPVQAEAQVVAKYAMVQGGMSRFAVLYPAHATGEKAMNAFKDQVFDLGGEVVTVERYSEDRDTDFRNQIVSIKRASPQAVFIPGQPRELVQIARQVAFYELECQLLGTDGWKSPEVIDRGGRFVEGVIFADFSGMSGDDYEKELFRARYREHFGFDPDHYASTGFDLAMCLRRAMEEGKTTRKGIRRFLEQIGPVNGVSGVLSWRDETSTHAIQLFTIANGLVVPITSIPQDQ